MRGGPTRAAAVAMLALGALSAPTATLARDAAPIAGIVRDALGRAIAGADVLISDGSVTPVAVLRSDAGGRVFLAELPKGPYRIAAMKAGYATLVARLDAGAGSFLDLILEPAASLDPETLPDDAWVLRSPRRPYLLRDVDHAPLDVALDAERALEIDHGESPVAVQVDHLVALRPGSHDGGGRREVGGTETAVRVRSGIGERGGIEVQGYRRAVESSRDPEGDREGETAERDATGVRVGFAYAPEPESDLAVSAYWGRSDVGFAPELSSITAPIAAVDREQRSWGYGASWSKPLDGDGRLDLSMDFRDTLVSHPPHPGPRPVDATSSPEPSASLSSRAVTAAGTYLRAVSDAHELQVEFGARILDAADALRVAPSATAAEVRGLPGLSFGVEASDRWSVAGPTSVLWGLGYRHTVQPTDVALVVPRIGGAWKLPWADVKAIVSYHDVTSRGADGRTPSTRVFRGSGELGYELTVALPVETGWRLTGSTSFVPSQLGLETCRPGAAGLGARVFVSDGDVGVREHRIVLARSSGSWRGNLDLTTGTARGTLDAILPIEAPIYELAERDLRYFGGSVGLRAVASGTSVTLSYRNVIQASPAAGSAASDELRLEAIELALVQDLFYLRSLGSWRALAAIRTADAVADGDDEDVRVVASTGRQFSAGVSVLF